MKYKTNLTLRRLLITIAGISLLLGACSKPTSTTPTLDPGVIQTRAVATFSIGLTQTALVQPTATYTVTPSPSPTATNTPTASPTLAQVVLPTSSCYVLTFMTDVTIPDNTKMTPGQVFTKTWRVKNSGTCDWEEGFQVKNVSGSTMSGKSYTLPKAVEPGKQVDISIEMTAPANAGAYTGNWRMATDSGSFFGDSFYVLILVGDSTTPTATKASPSQAPSQTPSETTSPTNTPEP
jgi:uncharacterized protein affecting Mg2+/Co2+ transport